jgi:class 3 adenylate cyclase
MNEDEQKGRTILNKNKELQKPIIEKIHGRWIKELGDGVLASFSSARDLVNCTCSILAWKIIV